MAATAHACGNGLSGGCCRHGGSTFGADGGVGVGCAGATERVDGSGIRTGMSLTTPAPEAAAVCCASGSLAAAVELV